MRLLTTFTLLTIFLPAIGQSSLTKKNQSQKKLTHYPQTLTYYPGTYIDTESKYSDSSGIVVIIQNSLPKGGGYVLSDPSNIQGNNPDNLPQRNSTDAAGKNFQYRIFWTRIINETDTPLELTINFPANESAAILPAPDSYLKIFLPTDTMKLEKEILYSYGATGLKSFIDANLNKPTMLKRTINPKEACLFYIGALFDKSNGAARARLVLKEKELFYSIRGITSQFDSALIPCGQIVFKK